MLQALGGRNFTISESMQKLVNNQIQVDAEEACDSSASTFTGINGQ
ncbi:hypothetical protein [Priestia abyssalis]|nr:hypothetical protein [Priestia abyssalis]